MFQVLLSSSLLRTQWLAVCSLLAANIKDVHTELISRGHLYNNTFAQSQRCSFDLEQWSILPFVWNMVISSRWALEDVNLLKYALMTTVKHLIISHSTARWMSYVTTYYSNNWSGSNFAAHFMLQKSDDSYVSGTSALAHLIWMKR